MPNKKSSWLSIAASCLICAPLSAFGAEQWPEDGSYAIGTSRGMELRTDEEFELAPQGENAGQIRMSPAQQASAAFNMQTDFPASFALYQQALKEGGTSGTETRAQVVKLLANSSFNVRTAGYRAKRDENTRRWIPDAASTVFVENDRVAFRISSDEDGFLYVFYQNVNGRVSLLYPNDLKNSNDEVVKKIEDFDNAIGAGEEKSIPDAGMWIRATAPYGCEYLLTVVTSKRLQADKLRALVDSGAALSGISSADFGELCKGVLENTAFSEDGTLKYGACRLSTAVLENQEAKDAYLAAPKTYFVGIGIDKYESDAVPNLPSCVNDVTRLATILQKQGSLDPANTLLITNADADADHIKFLFGSYLPELLRPCDRVIVHWSSHGATISSQMFFVPYDAQVLKNDLASSTGLISSDALNQWTYLMPGREILFLFDCCYSGGAIDREFEWVNSSFEKSLGGDDMLIIASSSDDEVSLVDRESRKASLMSKLLTDYIETHPNVDALTAAEAIAPEVEKISEEQFKLRQHVWWASALKSEDGQKFIINPTEKE